MKRENDFSGGERGKFYHPKAELNVFMDKNLWENFVSGQSMLSVPPCHKKELEKRRRDYSKHKSNFLTLKELQGRIEKRKSMPGLFSTIRVKSLYSSKPEGLNESNEEDRT